jgi:hypothetical protein
MPFHRLLLVLCLGLAAPAVAQTTDGQTAETAKPADRAAADVSVAALSQALQFEALFEALREEGAGYGEQLEADMFPGGGGPKWAAAVAAIYDPVPLRTAFEQSLEAELGADPEALSGILAFFKTDLGQRVVGLEISARRAFTDTATEEAARVAADDRKANRDPKVALLDRFIKAGDLIEMNVAGALSGNLAFMTGLSETGVYGQAMPADELMSDVWAQESQIRDDTTSWLHAYLGLAYDPLTEAELQTYIDFMESPDGQRLNAALFTAFDQVFRKVSNDLGRAAGLAMLGTDI